MTSDKSPVILWFRRDLRLEDHPALQAACAGGRPVIPVFVLDDLAENLGAAPKWRLGLGLGHRLLLTGNHEDRKADGSNKYPFCQISHALVFFGRVILTCLILFLSTASIRNR